MPHFARDGRVVAEVQDGQEVALRAIGREAAAGQARPQVAGEHGALADRVHAGLGQRGPGRPGRAVAGREHLLAADALERRAHAHEAVLVRLETGALEDRQARGARHPEHDVALDALPRVEHDPGGLDPRDARARADLDAPARGGPSDAVERVRRGPRQDPLARLEQRHAHVGHALAPQARVQREGDLDPRGASADDQRAKAGAPARALDHLVDAAHVLADGAARQRVLPHAGQAEPGHGRAHVEGDGVVDDGGPPLEREAARGGVQPGDRGHDAPRAGAHGERPHVDLELVAPVLARDEARHHAGVHGDRPVDDERDADAGHRRHRPATQDLDVGVAAADQDEIVAYRCLLHVVGQCCAHGRLVHRPPPRVKCTGPICVAILRCEGGGPPSTYSEYASGGPPPSRLVWLATRPSAEPGRN